MNIFISDELQPDEEFYGLYDDAIDSLYKELQRVLQNTFYGIHNLIEVSGETAQSPPSKLEQDARVIVSLYMSLIFNNIPRLEDIGCL